MSASLDSVKAPKESISNTISDVLDYDYSCEGENCPDSQYVEAVVGLAGLTNPTGSLNLDSSDFNALRKRRNLGLLADLIQNDPYLPIILTNKEALVKGKFQIDGNGHHGPVPKHYYKRLVYLSQIALKHLVDPELDTNGVYGPATTKAVAEFQKKVGIDGDGTKIGYQTISALVMRLRYSKEELVADLTRVRDELESSWGEDAYVYVKNDQRKEASPLVEDTLTVLTDALKWIGVLDIKQSPKLPTGSNIVKDALNAANESDKIDVLGKKDEDGDGKPDKVNDITKVGPYVLDELIDCVKNYEM